MACITDRYNKQNNIIYPMLIGIIAKFDQSPIKITAYNSTLIGRQIITTKYSAGY